MPLYVRWASWALTRRLSQQIDPQFHTMLMVAAAGTAPLIALGILCQLVGINWNICATRSTASAGDMGWPYAGSGQPRLRRRSITLPLCRTFTNVTPSGK
ncbi:hypothetical protein KCP69_22735 [Salmonella enterica subsp. enterica]|nr:hypothetical protein KCP69_22735 [Salmonella enterica subsp. enterica]